jgi:hypothetical protein
VRPEECISEDNAKKLLKMIRRKKPTNFNKFVRQEANGKLLQPFTLDILKDVTVLARKFKTSDDKSISSMFSDSWKAWKAAPGETQEKLTHCSIRELRDDLFTTSIAILTKMEFINIPAFIIFGGDSTRSASAIPATYSNELASGYGLHYSAEGEVHCFSNQVYYYMKSSQKVGELPDFEVEIDVDKDINYLKRSVKRILLLMCRNMPLLIT